MILVHMFKGEEQKAYVQDQAAMAATYREFIFGNLPIEPPKRLALRTAMISHDSLQAYEEPQITQAEGIKPRTREQAVTYLTRLGLPHDALAKLFGERLRYSTWKAAFQDPIELVREVAWVAWSTLKVGPFASAYLVTSGALDHLCEG